MVSSDLLILLSLDTVEFAFWWFQKVFRVQFMALVSFFNPGEDRMGRELKPPKMAIFLGNLPPFVRYQLTHQRTGIRSWIFSLNHQNSSRNRVMTFTYDSSYDTV